MNNSIFVTIIIPCRNEEKFIGKCLDSLVLQTYSKDLIEVLVVDGMSSDKTREIVRNYSQKYPFVRLLNNANKYTPFAFNIGIKNSKGSVIAFMGAHAGYAKNYISKCVLALEQYGADNVGGTLKVVPSDKSLIAKSIALSISNVFGSGNAHFKIESENLAREVDTVFGGCYRREVFNKIGLFNEKLLRSQDMEFNTRLKKFGGKIIFIPDIVSCYYAKANLKDFAVHNFSDGVWATYPAKFVKMGLKLRHYSPLIFVVILAITIMIGLADPELIGLFILIIGLYFAASLYFSMKIAIKEKAIGYFFVLPIIFAIRHIFYGIGSLWGLIKLLK